MIQQLDMNKFFKPRKFNFKKYIPPFIKNVWHFRKELNQFRPWDYCYNLMIFTRSLELLQTSIENGCEIEETRLPKVEAIKDTISILRDIEQTNHFERAMKTLNVKDEELPGVSEFLFKKLIERSLEIRDNDWDRLFRIIKDNNKGLLTWWD